MEDFRPNSKDLLLFRSLGSFDCGDDKVEKSSHDKMTCSAARFSSINIRHLTDSGFNRAGIIWRMTFFVKSRRNSGDSVLGHYGKT